MKISMRPAQEAHAAKAHHVAKTARQGGAVQEAMASATAQTEQAATTVTVSGAASLASASATGEAAAPEAADRARRAPPGLVRVAAKFEALGEAGRNRGQNNAMAQIQRHLQRYADVQELAPTTGGTPPTVTVVEPVAPAPAPVDASAPTTSVPSVDGVAPSADLPPAQPTSALIAELA